MEKSDLNDVEWLIVNHMAAGHTQAAAAAAAGVSASSVSKWKKRGPFRRAIEAAQRRGKEAKRQREKEAKRKREQEQKRQDEMLKQEKNSYYISVSISNPWGDQKYYAGPYDTDSDASAAMHDAMLSDSVSHIVSVASADIYVNGPHLEIDVRNELIHNGKNANVLSCIPRNSKDLEKEKKTARTTKKKKEQ